MVFPGATAVTSAELKGGTTAPSGSVAGGTTFEVQGTNFGPLAHLTVYLENQLGETVRCTAPVAGPPSTNPGATESVVVRSPAALDAFPGVTAVVLVGANGSSSETPSALFTYTS